MPEPADLSAPCREFFTAVRDALTLPYAATEDGWRNRERLLAERAAEVRGTVEGILDSDTPLRCLEALVGYLRERTRQLPPLYPQSISPARPLPDDCIICGPGCCAPVLGAHASCPSPLVGRTVASVR